MEKLRPEIREQVIAIIDALKGNKESLTEKSITDSFAYVRCPYCYSRVYRSNTILNGSEVEDGNVETKSDTEPEHSPSFWKQLNENIINH